MSTVKNVKGRQVYLRDEELLRRREENKNYLLELGSEHLLLPYLMEAGRCKMSETPEDIHGGWESPLCELRGHFLGHWLSAAAMHYEATGNEQVRAKAEEIVEELAVCQKDNGRLRFRKNICIGSERRSRYRRRSTRFTRRSWACWICMSWQAVKKHWMWR